MSNFSFKTFLESLNTKPLIDVSIANNSYVSLDLSIDNRDLITVNVSSSTDLENYIWNFMRIKNAKVAYGGYLEKRGIYNRSDYFNKLNPDEERNIHLGLDLWVEAGTPIYAPLDATVHSFNNNTNYGDYGPTLILKHSFDAIEFYTLYGHLSLDSLKGKRLDEQIKSGQQIAVLATSEVNGDYPPHLHFQIIKDIKDYKGDYPGVSNNLDLEFYKRNCPDPNWLLNL
ncbi:peptidoglycan DD-metalloendopeptidase family protein [Winogradskyella sp. PE311]|uniref:peptidoglycan DD-metalloendopeptidase family protein n=1 Tax=Winogradskyella sp. PE311 TaxID=3366943 RepID=UPI00397F73B8